MPSLDYGADPSSAVRRIIEIAHPLGIAKVVGEFYGGNDEGSLNDVILYNAEGQRIDGIDAGSWSQPDSIFGNLEAILYTKYGGFAGDFSVSGSLTIDVAKGTLVEEGSQQVWEDMPISEALNVQI